MNYIAFYTTSDHRAGNVEINRPLLNYEEVTKLQTELASSLEVPSVAVTGWQKFGE